MIHVLVVIAFVFLGCLFGAAMSVVAWLLFQAGLKLWELGIGGPSEVLSFATARQPDRPVGSVSDLELLTAWFVAGELTLSELEVLADEVLRGRRLPATAELALRVLWSEFDSGVVGSEFPVPLGSGASGKPCLAAVAPDLPPGYFDGCVSADEPEDSVDWVKVWRGDGTAYWIRGR